MNKSGFQFEAGQLAGANQKQRLVDLLLKCPSVLEAEARRTLVAQLPSPIPEAIEPGNNAKVHVLNIVNSCMNHPGGFEHLIKTVGFFDGKTTQFQALMSWFQRSALEPPGERSTSRADSESAAPEPSSPPKLPVASEPPDGRSASRADNEAPEPSSPPKQPAIGPAAYRHCDREDHDRDFRDFFYKHSDPASGEPQFYLLHGDEGECHDSFILRLCDTHIKAYAKREFDRQRADIFQISRIGWSGREPKSALQDINYSLCKALYDQSGERLEETRLRDSLARLFQTRTDSVIILSHHLAAQNWKRHTPELLERYHEECRKAYARALKKGVRAAHCLVFICLIYPGPEQLLRLSWWERLRYSGTRINRQLQQWQNTLPHKDHRCGVVQKLTSVPWEEAKECVAKLLPHEDEQLAQLQAIFGNKKTARMMEVEKALRTLIEKLEEKAI
ncbi:MAG: hypothetical protein GY862_22325 [Gammaproteobacteria bacterium]|nr:hypothetical protein [Gammaproteobacteria bacterium]